ncbi:hypothetical protein [Streptomyces sp. 8N706]|uniref:hypothetical protein n=1 Tax=Streptomyces sp. 8N706 TaxID=3457416 RepID=UPI003FD65AE4
MSVHLERLAALKTKAAAVRYAIEVLDSTHTPMLIDWLAGHGCKVNRGQAHKIAEAEAERRRTQRLAVLKSIS